MSFKGLGKKSKRILAFLLAMAMFFNAWVDYDVSALAEDKELSVQLESSTAEYTGNVITPNISKVLLNGSENDEISEYEVAWSPSEIKDVGDYTVTVSAEIEVEQDNGNGQLETQTKTVTGTATFTVTPFSLADCTIYIGDTPVGENIAYEYNGQAQGPDPDAGVISVKKGESPVSPDWYTCTVSPATSCDTDGSVVIAAKSENTNIEGEITKAIKISQFSLDDCTVYIGGTEITGETKYVYNGQAQGPDASVISVTKGGSPVSPDWYTCTVTKATNAGENVVIAITPKNEDNITGSTTINIPIEKQDLSNEVLVVEGIAESYTFTGKQIQPEITEVMLNGAKLTEADYTVEYGANNEIGEKKGTVTVTAKESGNYKAVSKEIQFNIVPLDTESATVSVNGTKNENAVDDWCPIPFS